jgi:hypothetical protein
MSREAAYIPLLKLALMVLEVNGCDLTNRVTASFKPMGSSVDSWRATWLRAISR